MAEIDENIAGQGEALEPVDEVLIADTDERLEDQEAEAETEAILAQLRTVGNPPGWAEAFFGQENIQKLMDLILDPRILEAEVLFHREGLSMEEICEYFALLPEYQALRQEFRELAQEYVKAVVPKIAYNWNKSPLKLFTSIIEMTMRLYVSEVRSYRTQRILEFRTIYLELLTVELLRNWSDRPAGKKGNYGLKEIIASGEGVHMQEFGYSSPERMTRDAVIKVNDVTKKYPNEYRQLLSLAGQEVSPEMVAQEFEELRELSSFRKADQYVETFGPLRIEIQGPKEELWKKERDRVICRVQIALDKNIWPKEGELWFDANGVIELEIDRATGDLIMDCTNIPISEVIGKEEYLRLKRIIYRLALTHFYGQEDFPEQLIAILKTEEELAQTTRNARSAVRETLSPAEEPQAEEPKAVVEFQAPVYEPYQAPSPDEIEPPLTEAFSMDEDAAANRKKMAIKKSLSGKRLRTVLEKLLGPPRKSRRGSSHVKFKARGSDRWYPMAFHEEVGIGLLLKCLKMWNVTVEEFSQAWK